MEFCFVPRTIKYYQILKLLNSKKLFSINGTWSYLKIYISYKIFIYEMVMEKSWNFVLYQELLNIIKY